MTYPARPYLLNDVAHAILSAATATLTRFGYLPEYRYVAAKGADWECCSTLAVIPAESSPSEGADDCSTIRTYRWSVEIGACVNEELRCGAIGQPCDAPARFDPCARPFPSKSAESRFLLGLRFVLERGLPDAVKCAIADATDCDGNPLRMRCRAARVAEVITVTEGACHIVAVVVETEL